MEKRNSVYAKYIKRMIDFLIALIGMIVIWPLFLIIYIIARFNMGKPVIFKQRRAGYLEREFTIYKFRTMNNKCNENGDLLPDEERLTKFGAFLRKTSLDEIPQLVNILKGDIALIGPRPLLVEYLPIYTEDERKRHLVRPGLFGLAGVNGRNNQSWDSKFRYDLQYVENISFKMDCYIFLSVLQLY